MLLKCWWFWVWYQTFTVYMLKMIFSVRKTTVNVPAFLWMQNPINLGSATLTSTLSTQYTCRYLDKGYELLSCSFCIGLFFFYFTFTVLQSFYDFSFLKLFFKIKSSLAIDYLMYIHLCRRLNILLFVFKLFLKYFWTPLPSLEKFFFCIFFT